MKRFIYIFIAISFCPFVLVNCDGSSQKKVSSDERNIVSSLTGCDVFLGKWRNEKNNWEISITKSDDSVYWARVPARTDVGFMDIGATCRDGKLMNGTDWEVVTFSNGKIKFNGTEYEKIE